MIRPVTPAFGAICLVLLFLGGCGGTRGLREAPSTSSDAQAPSVNAPDQDGPPLAEEIPPDVTNVPDAVPQPEDKSPYGNPDSYEVYGKRYEILRDVSGFRERGYASWYGRKFHGKRTSSGEPYNMFAMTAAHKTLPIPAYARITNLANGKSVVVKINDRGPFHDGRIVDLSYAAAAKLDMLTHGSTLVDLEVLSAGRPENVTAATAKPPANAATPLAAAGAPVAVATTPRYLQAGVFGDASKAAAFRERLDVAGVRPLLMKSESRNDRWVYRVLIGPFADLTELEMVRARMTAKQTPTVPVID